MRGHPPKKETLQSRDDAERPTTDANCNENECTFKIILKYILIENNEENFIFIKQNLYIVNHVDGHCRNCFFRYLGADGVESDHSTPFHWRKPASRCRGE